MRCPFCLDVVGTTKRAYASHVGRHMEEIALATLPMETDSDSETSLSEDARIASSDANFGEQLPAERSPPLKFGYENEIGGTVDDRQALDEMNVQLEAEPHAAPASDDAADAGKNIPVIKAKAKYTYSANPKDSKEISFVKDEILEDLRLQWIMVARL
ncbi:MAG: hypothetical protein M1833_003401 [Piccolia ochrophora]|nr:MAG: hypothetical protein M1833_003401 [Piccolia ochrophora]